MIRNVDKGSTLIVKGPARVSLLEGELDVLGKIYQSKNENSSSNIPDGEDENVLIIPSAHCYPFYAIDNIQLEIYTSNEENLKEIKENSISPTWVRIKDELIAQLKKERETPLKIMVLGFSSGKTTLIKYLANNFIKEGLKGGYLDSDLGQQIIYIPTTINLGSIKDYIISSEDIQSENTLFIGATFPKGDYKYIVSLYCRKMIDDYIAENKDVDFVLIDTDGWIKTEAGIVYKSFFIKSVNPDVLIAFHNDEIEELKEIEKNAASENKERKTYLIEDGNEHFYERDKDERRFLRQSQFSKKFEDFRKISIPLKEMKFIKTDYNKENEEILEQEVNINDLLNLPYHYVIIGLLTEDSKLIEIGLLFTINADKNYILLYSNLSYKQQLKVKKILLGSLRLSTKGNHQGYLY